MIRYPVLRPGMTVGVTAPSSGLEPQHHIIMQLAVERMEREGYKMIVGSTVWSQQEAKSAPAAERADELNRMLKGEETDLLIPPWGGELLIELIDAVDYGQLPLKWILGYSDTSVLLLAVTLKTGMATAHGTNLVDLRSREWDGVTARWQDVLSAPAGGEVRQHSSRLYQKEWSRELPPEQVFLFTEKTAWKCVTGTESEVEGRLLCGCIDVIRHLIGTPYGDVQGFRDQHIPGEPVLWVLENCELSTADLRRSLVQMRLAGWFDNCAGVLFGRSPANQPVNGYTALQVYRDLEQELGVPVIYDIDCGHVPPQLTFINGAWAKFKISGGAAEVLQRFV